MSHTRALFSAALLCCAAFVSGGGNGALTFSLELGETRCFYEEIQQVDTKLFMHVVTLDGGYDLTTAVSGPFSLSKLDRDTEPERNDKSNLLYESSLSNLRGEQKLLFRAQGENAVYRFCVTNGAVMLKSVMINIASHDPLQLGVGPFKPMDPIKKTIIRLSESMHQIKEEQIFLRTRERLHREVAEKTFERVVFWSLFAIVMLSAMGGGQLWYYHRLFGGSSVRARGV